MILRYLSRSQWERILIDLGAEPLKGKGALNSAEWWRIPGKPPFTVPVEDEKGRCDYWAIQKLRDQLNGSMRFKGPEDE